MKLTTNNECNRGSSTSPSDSSIEAEGVFEDGTLRSQLRASLAINAPFLIVAVLYVVTATSVFIYSGLPLPAPGAYLSHLILYLAAAIFFLGPLLLSRLLVERPERPFSFLREMARRWRLYDRFILALPAVLALIIFWPSFSAFKSAIPAFQAFAFDPIFIRWDEAIHGQDAWRLIHPIVGYPIVSFILNGVYHVWLMLLYIGMLPVLGWIEQRAIRMQFLVATLLCWVLLGTVGAILTSSVGPCFYEFFYGDDRFRPLMNYLAQADRVYPLMALDVQESLLAWAAEGGNGVGRGISAMPSMHLSIACLFAILGWRVSKAWGIAGTIFLILILVGSVHLGYHYAIDGYAAIVATMGIWWLSGLILSSFAMPMHATVKPSTSRCSANS